MPKINALLVFLVSNLGSVLLSRKRQKSHFALFAWRASLRDSAIEPHMVVYVLCGDAV